MARINIEDTLFSDPRFIRLCIKLGCEFKGMGAVVAAFKLAQEHFLNKSNDRLIPVEDWKRRGIPEEFFEVGLAEIRDRGIYVSGSETQFSWLIQKQDAGKKSAEAKRAAKDAERDSTGVNGRSTEVNGAQPPTLTPSPSLSQALALSQTHGEEISISEILKLWNIPQVLFETWVMNFRDRSKLEAEILNAYNYAINQPKPYKDFKKFLSGWLGRSQKAPGTTFRSKSEEVADHNQKSLLELRKRRGSL